MEANNPMLMEGLQSQRVTHTPGQGAVLLCYIVALVLWLYAESLYRTRMLSSHTLVGHTDPEAPDTPSKPPPPTNLPLTWGGFLKYARTSGAFKCLRLHTESLLEYRPVLRSMVEFGTIMLWFYVADRTRLLNESPKSYSRDFFIFIFMVMVAVGCSYSWAKSRASTLLNRNQTEEWKGWMQVLFLLYHYFEAVEAYNAIRVFIAGYVWMTGFGNFMYYYKTSDFGIGRFAQMMWRLNFLVFFCCIVMRNSYMLYYICPMHTLFTVMVYACLAIWPAANKTPWLMAAKIAGCFALVFVVWDIPAVFYALWRPFGPLVTYVDPRREGVQDPLHEWFFRSGLDRYVWIWGMLCGWAQPAVNGMLSKIDESSRWVHRWALRGAIAGVALLTLYLWWEHVFTLPKYEYNALHPFTSWIPITAWIFLRNLTVGMKTWSIGIFQWCGCITLETYISQFHIWMSTAIPDGQPKMLLDLVPGYPLVNFAVVSALYVTISKRLFNLTNDLKNAFVPHDDNRLLARNCAIGVACGGGLYVIAMALEAALE